MAFARWLIIAGFALLALGLLALLLVKLGIPLGKLPGDIAIKGKRYSVYFPIVTSIVISVALTILVNFVLWILRK